MKLKVVSTTGKNSTITVSDAVFNAKPNQVLLAQAIRVYQFNQRQGTSATKTRSDINRTKKKWFKQKGTGNARHGARTPNIFVGGGVSHGPTGTENWKLSLSKKMKKRAMRVAVSLQSANIVVADEIAKLNGKTSEAAKLLKETVGQDKKVLVVLAESSQKVIRSMRNLPNVLVVTASRLSILEVAHADVILTTKDALKILEERLTVESNKEPKVEPKKKAVKEEKPKSVKPAAKKKAPAAKKKTTKSTKETK